MTKFALKTRFSSCPDAEIQVGRYSNGSTAWNVIGDCGEGYPENIGTPTVALDVLPPDGCVFIRIGDEYKGWLESLVKANVVEDIRQTVGSGYVSEYATACRVRDQSLLAPLAWSESGCGSGR